MGTDWQSSPSVSRRRGACAWLARAGLKDGTAYHESDPDRRTAWIPPPVVANLGDRIEGCSYSLETWEQCRWRRAECLDGPNLAAQNAEWTGGWRQWLGLRVPVPPTGLAGFDLG